MAFDNSGVQSSVSVSRRNGLWLAMVGHNGELVSLPDGFLTRVEALAFDERYLADWKRTGAKPATS
jgi:hypothetical protein